MCTWPTSRVRPVTMIDGWRISVGDGATGGDLGDVVLKKAADSFDGSGGG